MSVRLMTLILAVAIALFTGGTAAVASDQATAKDQGAEATEAASAKPPNIVIPQASFEFEPVVDGTEVTHDFPIKNTGDGELSIRRVKTG
jgi:archaellum component FlaG (FlaF/FlaG flagellin family)